MMEALKHILLFTAVITILSCGSGGGDNTDPMPVDPPTAASLLFPLNNSECTEGTNITPTQSTISFDWSDSNNTDSYQLVLKNLNSQTSQNYTSTLSDIDITLPRGVPFSWYVISKANGTTQTAQSPTWKFYNAGEATTSYAPFPAELITPVMGTAFESNATSVKLVWNGNDVDDDISEFEVLFGTDNPPSTSKGTTASSNMTVTISTGNTYFWRVITKDGQNNSSNSDIFQFKVN